MWDSFVCHANDGTVFHQLNFLAYHGARFQQQEHHLIWYNGQQLFGLMPMGIFEEQAGRVALSPYGASYGGPVFERPLSYGTSREVVARLIDYLVEQEVNRCQLTLPISCCYADYSETFRLALLEQGFRCINRDISSVVALGPSVPVARVVTSRARNSARTAAKSGVTFTLHGSVKDFWRLMEKTYQKHQTDPTHTVEEFQWLCEHLPESVYVDVAYLDGQAAAGIGYFVINRRVNSSFYLCQDPEIQAAQALTGLIYDALQRAQESGFRWFDFGTSSVKMEGRENIFRFKESFGAVGMFRDTYAWQH
jgi:hypothetical protein